MTELPVSGRNPGLLETVRREMRLRAYSPRTIKSYVSCLRLFIRHISPLHPRDVSDREIRAFMLRMIDDEYAVATVHQVINALRFLYVELYQRPMVLGELPRPKRERKLPVVLSEEDISQILDATENLKHKALLSLIYSAGLRVGEAVTLRWEDLDENRNMMHIRNAKGKKDRYTILSDVVIEMLERYAEMYHPHDWLFEGQDRKKHLSVRSAEYVFQHAVRRSGIRKNVSIHSLRHAFATHLLEHGTDLRYIQHLLGHRSIKTTEVYSHVSSHKIAKLRSPIENIRGKTQQRNDGD